LARRRPARPSGPAATRSAGTRTCHQNPQRPSGSRASAPPDVSPSRFPAATSIRNILTSTLPATCTCARLPERPGKWRIIPVLSGEDPIRIRSPEGPGHPRPARGGLGARGVSLSIAPVFAEGLVYRVDADEVDPEVP